MFNFNNSIISLSGWIITILLSLICFIGRLYYNNQINKLTAINDAYKQANEENKKVISTLTDEYKKTNQILKERDAELEAIKAKSNDVKIQIKEVIKNDVKAKDWGDTPIPESVLTKLRKR